LLLRTSCTNSGLQSQQANKKLTHCFDLSASITDHSLLFLLEIVSIELNADNLSDAMEIQTERR